MAKKNKMNEVEVVGPSEALARSLTAQYRRAEGARGAFMREAVAFGAALIEAEEYLVTAGTKYKTCGNLAKGEDNAKKGRWGEGRPNSGLEAWLAANCPEISYATAKSYKMYATRVIAMMGGETLEVMAALRCPNELKVSYEPSGAETDPAEGVETVSDAIIEAREALFTEATSRRKLEQMWLRFACDGEPRGPGRPKGSGTAGRRAATAEERAADAEALTRETLGRVTSYLAGAWIETVAPETRDDFVRTLRDCADLAEERARRAAR